MTKKHFEEIAAIISQIPYEEQAYPCLLFANFFEKKYPMFKRNKFLKACGLPLGKS